MISVILSKGSDKTQYKIILKKKYNNLLKIRKLRRKTKRTIQNQVNTPNFSQNKIFSLKLILISETVHLKKNPFYYVLLW